MNPNSTQGIRFLRGTKFSRRINKEPDLSRRIEQQTEAQGATPGFTAASSPKSGRHRPTSLRRHVTADRFEDGIADGFINERIIPQLKDGTDRLRQIELDDENAHIIERISSHLSRCSLWRRRIRSCMSRRSTQNEDGEQKAPLFHVTPYQPEGGFPIVSKFLGTADKTKIL